MFMKKDLFGRTREDMLKDMEGSANSVGNQRRNMFGLMKIGGGTHTMPDGSVMLNSDMPMKHGGSMPSKISIKPMPSPSYTLMLSPLAMKMGGIVDSGLYKSIQSIGYGNKTYLSSI